MRKYWTLKNKDRAIIAHIYNITIDEFGILSDGTKEFLGIDKDGCYFCDEDGYYAIINKEKCYEVC